MKKFILFIFISTFLMQCDLISPNVERKNREIVVNGYIFSGKPMANFTLSRELAIDDTTRNYISNATIELISANHAVTLEEKQPGKYFQTTQNYFQPGEFISITITTEDGRVEYEITLPDTVTDLTLNQQQNDTIDFYFSESYVSWNADEDSLWLCCLETLTTSDDSIDTIFTENNWEFVYNEPAFSIPYEVFWMPGKYRFHVCRVDENYQKMNFEHGFLPQLSTTWKNELGFIAGFGHRYIDFEIPAFGE